MLLDAEIGYSFCCVGVRTGKEAALRLLRQVCECSAAFAMCVVCCVCIKWQLRRESSVGVKIEAAGRARKSV
jgi:hypothetical protein